MSDKNEGFMLTGPTYDKIKYFNLIILPALGTLYFVLGNLWGFPKIEEVVGTTAALGVFLGALLRKSNVNYDNSDERYDGDMIVTRSPEGIKSFNAQLRTIENPHDIDQKGELVFKVTKVEGPPLDVDPV